MKQWFLVAGIILLLLPDPLNLPSAEMKLPAAQQTGGDGSTAPSCADTRTNTLALTAPVSFQSAVGEINI